MSPLTDQNRPGRRALLRTAAWTAPSAAVATAAPAFAVSCSTPAAYTAPLRTGSYARTNSSSGRGTATSTAAGAGAVTYTIRSTVGAGTATLNNNLSVAGDTNSGYNGAGGLVNDGLQLQQTGSAAGQNVTIAFSRPVTQLSFTVADIDTDGTLYTDSVSFLPTPTAVVNNSAVTGAGTAASPLRSSNSTQVTSDVLANRSKVTFAGPLTSLTINYASTRGSSSQQIFLTGMTFSSTVC